eukprot:CAMPEP_0176372262 /NCGR_PEP_ID=MMETSP0126-20121128/25276_1 /TAXON_ID=141414 ORGANISM="Strombidinopsis acuminatum, Strain SPMC142" /NCGR_SAMPLE_ID=MMETSP0126 /ASSEMBLY_ACC=CAM_ASM_000229 /LENGTH=70 /DNA_ID=CAMNT_0017732051 /DNA_START=485 /DNA_END=697 /DNA_ORIENTATION=-
MLMTGLIFPFASNWIWGGGWLSNIGFIDYAGSAGVHLLGGSAGLIGTILLGPRYGFFKQNADLDKFLKKT